MSKMALALAGLISATLWGTTIVPSGGDPGATLSDVFDMSHGTIVNSSSAVIDGYDVRDILGSVFGGTCLGCEGAGKVLFKDINNSPWPFGPAPPAGASDYFLTFTTLAPVDLSSYNLYLQDDFLDGDANRTVSRFRLFLDDGAGNPSTLLSDVTILNSGQVNYRSVFPGNPDDILVSDTFGTVTGSQFSAVFTSNPLATTGAGPRVFELDGFSPSDVPEPATPVLIAAGALGLLLKRKLLHGQCQR